MENKQKKRKLQELADPVDNMLYWVNDNSAPRKDKYVKYVGLLTYLKRFPSSKLKKDRKQKEKLYYKEDLVDFLEHRNE
jgi:hypothetical protein